MVQIYRAVPSGPNLNCAGRVAPEKRAAGMQRPREVQVPEQEGGRPDVDAEDVREVNQVERVQARQGRGVDLRLGGREGDRALFLRAVAEHKHKTDDAAEQKGDEPARRVAVRGVLGTVKTVIHTAA